MFTADFECEEDKVRILEDRP